MWFLQSRNHRVGPSHLLLLLRDSLCLCQVVMDGLMASLSIFPCRSECLSYCSTATKRRHDQGSLQKKAFNLSWGIWQQAGRQAGRHGIGAVAESSHLIHKHEAERTTWE